MTIFLLFFLLVIISTYILYPFLDDVAHVREKTGVQGVMPARGLLENPAMYAGYNITPDQVRRASNAAYHI